ncbi:hypothetical protein N8G13_01085 [Mycoplasma zalophi]|uniref:hypothetical protein n=1 Tax=Mycoplasma zalophi TaxID=191287 RepID=UPI0021C88B46|nr:hypothetical protein [Mycoplasma zalophi]MCU4117058.1 hypothetical protein [Mycoplasma zalophi]
MTNNNDKDKTKKSKFWILIIFLAFLSVVSITTISTYVATKNKNNNFNKQQEINENFYKSQLKSLENTLLDKSAEIFKLQNQLKDKNTDQNKNQEISNKINSLNTETKTIRDQILALNSILKNKDIEIEELHKKITEYQEKYSSKENINNEIFKSENFDEVLITNYETNYKTDPLKSINLNDFSSKATLKRDTNSNDLTDKEFLFEFDDLFYENRLSEEQGYGNFTDDEDLTWWTLIFYALIYSGSIPGGPGFHIDNSKLFYFFIGNGTFVDITFLKKDLTTETINYVYDYRKKGTHPVKREELYKHGNHYKVIITIKPGNNKYSFINDYPYSYFVNRDWNIKNYSIEQKYQDNPDIKFYWKEYKDKDNENNIPAHIDLIIYLSAKKQKELFGSWDADLDYKKGKIKEILQKELETKEWYKNLDKTNIQEVVTESVDHWSFTLETPQPYNNPQDNHLFLYFNILRINFMENEDD